MTTKKSLFKCFLVLLFANVLLSNPFKALAWGKEGHQMVAQIGFDMLTPATKQVIQKYLDSISVPRAGTWMDDQRNNPKYAYMKSWHFINIDEDQQYQPSNDPNVVNEINNAIAELKHKGDLTPAKIQLDILVLFHLVGDIAQPLHDGYGSDRGGNDINVKYFGKKSNLHKVWDSEIIQSEGITKENCEAQKDNLSDEQKENIVTIDAVAWMKDARNLLPRVYKFEDNTIDDAYVSANKTIIEKQILYAGMRLAATIEDLFGTTATTHAPKATVKTSNVGTVNDVITLPHNYYTSHFSTSLHIPWVVEYTLRADEVNCSNPLTRSNKFAPDPLNLAATSLDKDYKNSGYDRGHNMPAADNGCHGAQAMTECFYFSNMFPQTHRLNAGVWKTLEEQERNMAAQDDSIYVWIGSYQVATTIGPDNVVVPKFCWKVIYDYKTEQWSAYIFPNTTDVAGKPEDFTTTVDDIEKKSGYHFQ